MIPSPVSFIPSAHFCDLYFKHNDGAYFADKTGWELSFPGSRAPGLDNVIDLQVHA